MGKYEDDEKKYREEVDHQATKTKTRKIVNTCVACLWSFLVSMTGGLILVWWEYEYHPTNSQQWMVPFGLILFVTPAFVWFAVFISEAWNPTEGDQYDDSKSTSQPGVPACDSELFKV